MDRPDSVTLPRRSWSAIMPAGLGALLIVAFALGETRLGGFVILQWLPWAVPLGLALLALAGWLAFRRLVWRLVSMCLLGTLALLSVAYGLLLWWALGSDYRQALDRVPAATGHATVIVYEGSNLIDPTWVLELRWGGGLTQRRWDLACINSDVSSFGGVRWLGRDRLMVEVGNRQVEIELDDSTGRPQHQVSAGCYVHPA